MNFGEDNEAKEDCIKESTKGIVKSQTIFGRKNKINLNKKITFVETADGTNHTQKEKVKKRLEKKLGKTIIENDETKRRLSFLFDFDLNNAYNPENDKSALSDREKKNKQPFLEKAMEVPKVFEEEDLKFINHLEMDN